MCACTLMCMLALVYVLELVYVLALVYALLCGSQTSNLGVLHPDIFGDRFSEDHGSLGFGSAG